MKVEQRKVGAGEIDRQRAGGQTLGPGVWIDRKGDLHFSVPDVLAFLGVEDTSDNRALFQQIVREQIAERSPDATIVEQEELLS